MPSIKLIETPEKTLIRHVLHATTGDQRYPCKSAPTHGSSAINTTPSFLHTDLTIFLFVNSLFGAVEAFDTA
jgi:hypothetical protein